MAFFTRCCASKLRALFAPLLHAALVVVAYGFAPLVSAQNAVEINTLRVEQAADGMYLSANLRFELSQTVQAALLKGIPISFLAEAQVNRDRWYWYDKGVAYATRSVRLAYQPLTRRWRINVSTGSLDNSGGASLSQNFDQLQDALAAVRGIASWKIAEGSDIEPDARHNIDFSFRLDTSALPRPMQIGIASNAEWNLQVQRSLRPGRP